MAKVAIVILADTETGADSARVANALTTAYEFKEAGEEVTLVFTGAGTKRVGELPEPDHPLNRAFRLVEEEVVGACKACGVPLLAEYRGHQSLRRLISEGYQVVTF